MKNLYLTIIFFLIISIASVNAYDPTVYVSNNTYLLIHENNEIPKETIEIQDEGNNYFVVVVYSGSNITGFLALNKEKEELISKPVTLRRLFQTTSFIKEYVKLKNNIIKNQTASWFVSESLKAKSIAQLLKNKEQELAIIDVKLNDSEATKIINSMDSSLELIIFSMNDLADKMKDATTFENSFVALPETGNENALVTKINDIADEIIYIEGVSSEYNSNLTLLKAAINASDIDIDTKRSLSSLAEMPNDFQQSVIFSWFSNAGTLKDSLNLLLEQAKKDAASKADAFLLRIKRNTAMNIVYSEDEKLKKLGEMYSSLKKTADVLLFEENRYKWKDQADLLLFETQWQQTKNYLQRDNYDNAIIYAEKAKNNAVKIINLGTKETEQQPIISYNLAIETIIILIALLVILLVWKNKDKWFKKEKSDKIEVYEY